MSWTEILIQIALLAATSSITWVFSRRKYNAEVKGNELDNFQKANDIWQNLIDDLRNEIDVLRKENRELKVVMRRLEKAINDVKKCTYADSCPVINKLSSLPNDKADNNGAACQD
jgi:peptidoglycan hydrolase CwlO-like protein